jgi:hypothetical protein
MSVVCKGECGGSTTPYQTSAIPSNLTRLQIRLKLLLLFIAIRMLFVKCVGITTNECVFQKTATAGRSYDADWLSCVSLWGGIFRSVVFAFALWVVDTSI